MSDPDRLPETPNLGAPIVRLFCPICRKEWTGLTAITTVAFLDGLRIQHRESKCPAALEESRVNR